MTYPKRGRRGLMAVVLQHRVRTPVDTTLCDNVCQWFSPGTPVSSTNKTDHYDITEIVLKVVLSTINLSLNHIRKCIANFTLLEHASSPSVFSGFMLIDI
jgi:hypothetical protein